MQKVRGSLKRIIVIVIAIILIPVLAVGVNIAKKYAVIYDYDGINFYDIETTERIKYSDAVDKTVNITSQVKRLKNLRSLDLYQKQKDDLSFLKNFYHLETLRLTDDTSSRIADLDTLPAIPNLNELVLYNYTKKGLDCSALGQLSSLEFFFAFSSNMHDWSFVENLPNLKYIYHINGYMYTEGFDEYDWTPLESAKSLEKFEVTNVYYDKALLEALEKLPSLNHVYLAFYRSEELSDEDRTYIFGWIERMEENGAECQVVDFNYHFHG